MLDAIVVGARCAGAAIAMLLARRDYKILLLDRDAFPSDHVASTHMIWPAGVVRLVDWGLLDKIKASGCPAMSNFNLDFGAFALRGKASPASGMTECYAPRRYVLDTILVNAAVEAGAKLERGSVTDLVWADDRVVGVRYSGASKTFEARARIVIGADGSNSTVARLCGAQTYNEQARFEGTMYAYFSDLPLDDMEFYSAPGRLFYSWGTNDGLTLAGVNVPYQEFRTQAQDPEANFVAGATNLFPAFAARVKSARRESEWMSCATRSFYRKASGPGWALVGDAGLTMDPITAAGITNAFRDAELLTSCIDQSFAAGGSPEASLSRFGELRDSAATPLFMFTSEMAKLQPPPQPILDLFCALQHSPEDVEEYFGIFAQSVSPQRFFSAENMERIMRQIEAT